MVDKIFLRDLRVDCIIGILPFERVKEQPLIVNLTLSVDLEPCATHNDLTLSVDYAKLAKDVTCFIKNEKEELLEVLAQKICSLIFKEYSAVTEVLVNLAKPEAIDNCSLAGIEIIRHR